MNTEDLIKKSVLDGFKMTNVSIESVGLTLGITFLIGLFIFIIYRRCFTGAVFSRSLGLSLIMLTMVTGVVIMVISSNLMLSLGMVGALSIVRFRTAIKDPMDTIFMFWAIAAGIVTGAQLYTVAIIASVGIGILMVILSFFKFKKHKPFIMVLKFAEEAKGDVQKLLSHFEQGKLKSKTVSRGIIELTIELNVTDEDIALMDKFSHIPGVYDASLVSYTGDVVA